MTIEAIETRPGDLKTPLRVILAISAAVFFFLLWMLFFKEPRNASNDSMAFMPAMNSGLNALSAILLLSGYTAIRRGNIRVHMACMIGALVVSAAFLVSYLIYHNIHGDTPYPGEGPMRYLYFGVLISHIGCTVFALPLILTTFFLAFTRRFSLHPTIARIALPLWLYVSVTGVAIFFLLRSALAAAGG